MTENDAVGAPRERQAALDRHAGNVAAADEIDALSRGRAQPQRHVAVRRDVRRDNRRRLLQALARTPAGQRPSIKLDARSFDSLRAHG